MAIDPSIQPDDVVALLAGTSLFGDFDAASLHKIIRVFEYHRIAGGETRVRRGWG